MQNTPWCHEDAPPLLVPVIKRHIFVRARYLSKWQYSANMYPYFITLPFGGVWETRQRAQGNPRTLGRDIPPPPAPLQNLQTLDQCTAASCRHTEGRGKEGRKERWNTQTMQSNNLLVTSSRYFEEANLYFKSPHHEPVEKYKCEPSIISSS